jgi:hypothetical protein
MQKQNLPIFLKKLAKAFIHRLFTFGLGFLLSLAQHVQIVLCGFEDEACSKNARCEKMRLYERGKSLQVMRKRSWFSDAASFNSAHDA